VDADGLNNKAQIDVVRRDILALERNDEKHRESCVEILLASILFIYRPNTWPHFAQATLTRKQTSIPENFRPVRGKLIKITLNHEPVANRELESFSRV